MKKTLLFLSLCLSLSLLAACASNGQGAPVPGGTPSEEPQTETTQSAQVTETFRIVAGTETGNLVLAGTGESDTGVYTLSMEQLSAEPQFAEPLRPGQLINVYYDSIAESWPMQFGGEVNMEPVEGGFDDRCALYLKVLEDLWAVDSGLNGGVEVIGVDLSQTSLNPAERAAVAWAFARNHDVEWVDGTLEQLTEWGWITATPLSSTGSGEDLSQPEHFFYEWENGCHFSITERPMDGVYSLVPVTFDAQKWRSSLGAYFFTDCTAVQSALGQWSEYHIGAEAIS